jgi:hypothetical protein
MRRPVIPAPRTTEPGPSELQGDFWHRVDAKKERILDNFKNKEDLTFFLAEKFINMSYQCFK